MPTDEKTPAIDPSPIEDKFFSKDPSKPADSTPATDIKDKSSVAPSQEGAAKTEATPEPAEHETEPEDKGSKSPRLSFRELRTQRDQAQARADLLEKQLAERNKAASSPAAPVAEVKPAIVDPLKPKSEDFATYDEFLDARDKYNRTIWEKEQVEKHTQAEQEKAREEIKKIEAKRLEDWNAAEKIVMAKQPDYNAHFEAFLKVAKTNPSLAVAVYKSKIGPDVASFLGASPEDLTRISQLAPEDLWKAIGVIEDKLQAKDSVKPTVTKAPRPLADVSGTASAAAKGEALEDRFYGKAN